MNLVETLNLVGGLLTIAKLLKIAGFLYIWLSSDKVASRVATMVSKSPQLMEWLHIGQLR